LMQWECKCPSKTHFILQLFLAMILRGNNFQKSKDNALWRGHILLCENAFHYFITKKMIVGRIFRRKWLLPSWSNGYG
jgi:hypothetical protein